MNAKYGPQEWSHIDYPIKPMNDQYFVLGHWSLPKRCTNGPRKNSGDSAMPTLMGILINIQLSKELKNYIICDETHIY